MGPPNLNLSVIESSLNLLRLFQISMNLTRNPLLLISHFAENLLIFVMVPSINLRLPSILYLTLLVRMSIV